MMMKNKKIEIVFKMSINVKFYVTSWQPTSPFSLDDIEKLPPKLIQIDD
jgi:hypothetical protein